MSPILKVSTDPLNCSRLEDIKAAFCISHKLFDKNNTCTHEPLEQTCYVNREMNSIPQSNDECYEGFYARCHMNDYRKHVETDACVLAESSLLEWCICKKTKTGMETLLRVQKDCTCFPHHTRPYKIFKLSEDNHGNNSCICANIYRKKCDFPKNRTVIHEAINCTSVDETLAMENLMHCEESEHVKKIIEYSKKRSKQTNNPYSTRFTELRKETLVNRRNQGKNSTEKISQKSQTQTPIKTQEESSLQEKTLDSNKTSEVPKTTHNETHKPIAKTPLSLEETVDSVTQNNGTIDILEANLENELGSLLNTLLGNKSYAELDKMLEPSNVNQGSYKNHSSLEETNKIREQSTSDLSKHHISKKVLKLDTSDDSNTLNGHLVSTFNDNYYHLENYQKENILGAHESSTQTKILPFTLITSSLILALIGFFLFKKARKPRKYINAEKTIEREREVGEEVNDDSFTDSSLMEDNVNSERNTLENKRRTARSLINTFKNSVLYVKNPKEDKELLIANEEIIE